MSYPAPQGNVKPKSFPIHSILSGTLMSVAPHFLARLLVASGGQSGILIVRLVFL
jgi:hypothetical protein